MRDKLEADFLAGAGVHRHKLAAERAPFMARCFAEADRATLHWTEKMAATPPRTKLPRGYQKIWQKSTQEAGYNFSFRADFASSPGS